MKLKPLLKYELKRSLGLLLGFYLLIFAAPYLFIPIIMIFSGGFSSQNLLGWINSLIPHIFESFASFRNILLIDSEVFVFLVLLGMISFAPGFRISQSLNVSRKALFKSQLLHMGIVGGVAALVNSTLSFLASCSTYYQNAVYPMFFLLNRSYFLPGRFSSSDLNEKTTAALQSAPYVICYFLWTFCISAMAVMLGYLISVCFYRMTSGLHRQFIIVAPVFVLPTLSYVFASLSSLLETQLLGDIYITAFIFTPTVFLQNKIFYTPYFAALFHVILFAAFGFLCWLLLRRLTVSLPDPPNRKFGIFFTAASKQVK